MQDKPLIERDWREVPRSEMFSRVIVATDCARIDAIAYGDEDYPRYVEDVLWPFLDNEKAERKERLQGRQ